jgi:hypothetical protein
MTPSNLEIIEFCNKIADDQLTLDEIRVKILNGIYTLDEIEECIRDSNLSRETFEIIKRYLNFNVPLDYYDFKDYTPLLHDRTDIYVLGNWNSGKSTFLASLFSYLNRNGLLHENAHSLAGTHYKNNLQFGFDLGFFPQEGFSGVNYICCDIVKPINNQVHPLNIIEIRASASDYSLELINFLKNNNPKILFFIIDFNEKRDYNYNHCGNLISLLSRIKEVTLQHTTSINLIITKCDLFPKGEDPILFATKYLDKNYLSLMYCFKEIQSKYMCEFRIKVFPYSVGELSLNSTYIKDRNNFWPKMIIDEIVSTTFYKKKSTGFFSRFFK